MNADSKPHTPTSTPPGGSVEPSNRTAASKARVQASPEAPAPRYELRDPFAEVTYRTAVYAEMTAKADQLGSTKFVEIDAAGKRKAVNKENGRWPDVGVDRQASSTLSAGKAASEPRPAPSADKDAKPPSKEAEIDAKAERALLVERIQAALAERYIIKPAPVSVGDLKIGHTEYRFRGDTTRIAFTESTLRLATDANSPSVARSMVDVAQARNWGTLKVSGHDDFKRMVWLDASSRGIKTLGYEPSHTDLELLKKARETRMLNRVEPAPQVAQEKTSAPAASDTKASNRGGSRKAVLAAVEAVLIAKKVPEAHRVAIMAAATERLAQRTREGQSLKVKVYDASAPSQRETRAPIPEVQRSRERAAPVR